MHQHIKNSPGKLMNILVKPSPKSLNCRIKNRIESPQEKDSIRAHSRAHPCPFLGKNFLFLRVPTGRATRGAVGTGSSAQAHPLILSPGLPFSLTSQ